MRTYALHALRRPEKRRAPLCSAHLARVESAAARGEKSRLKCGRAMTREDARPLSPRCALPLPSAAAREGAGLPGEAGLAGRGLPGAAASPAGWADSLQKPFRMPTRCSPLPLRKGDWSKVSHQASQLEGDLSSDLPSQSTAMLTTVSHCCLRPHCSLTGNATQPQPVWEKTGCGKLLEVF